MIALSISIEGMFGLTWPHWKQLVSEVEQLGFAGLFLSDHFTLPMPTNADSLELIVALTYLADHTRTVHFGSMVAPLSFRDPVLLARQAAALDDLSGGRMILGVGTSWMEREHTMFGYDLGDVPTRLDRLEEGLEVITRLLRSDEPVSYAGRFYQLRDAVLRPRPQRPGGPRILIGGSGPKRTLPLVAQYADIWNGQPSTPDEYRERSAQLDTFLRLVGRQPSDVKRTMTAPVHCARDQHEFEQRMRGLRRASPEVATIPLDDLLTLVRTGSLGPKAIVGTPDEVIEQIRAYATVGVEEFVVQWITMEDIAGLQLLAEEVMPYLAA